MSESEPCQPSDLHEVGPSDRILTSARWAEFHLGHSSTCHIPLRREYLHAFEAAVRHAAWAEQG